MSGPDLDVRAAFDRIVRAEARRERVHAVGYAIGTSIVAVAGLAVVAALIAAAVALGRLALNA